MKVIRNLKNISAIPPLALAIGNFDGVHCGHLAIIDEVKKIAKAKNLSCAILTFEPHPVCFFNKEKKHGFRITTLSQKLKIFRDLGIDYCIVLPFNHDLSEINADDFINKILLKSFNTKHLVVGYDFIFGKNRQGNFDLLKESSQKFDFGLSKVEAKKDSAEIFSSSLVRKAISQGNIKKANKLLNKKFSICGIVVNGRKLASQLGFPTANVNTKPQVIQPKFGVYKTSTFIPKLNKTFPSITNFGVKPTIDDKRIALFENHILGFSQNLYDQKIIIEFEDFIRDEKKFSSIEELKEQITSDIKKINL